MLEAKILLVDLYFPVARAFVASRPHIVLAYIRNVRNAHPIVGHESQAIAVRAMIGLEENF